ncbi:unnamed protein product [Phytophthora lilii]|uniref:Unnamed protein product n=1 Tax=Phytophthora lilii TaxID=2077276 RepID=A0A9W6TKG2_9STRA|nr:unnamed protein product [Phytophthora lilii]
MESLYARDTPTAQERKLKLAKREQAAVGQTDAAKQQEASRQEQQAEALAGLMDAATEASPNTATDSGAAATTDATANAADDFGFNFASLPSEDAQQQLEGQWRSSQDADPGVEDGKAQQKSQAEDKKTEGHLAELSGEPTASSTLSAAAEKVETKKTESNAPASAATPAEQPRRAGVASVPRKPKPAITINTGSGSTGIGAKRPPPTPVSPPTFSWNDILRVQNLIERCLQQYLSKLQLKEQIIAFNYLVWLESQFENNCHARKLTFFVCTGWSAKGDGHERRQASSTLQQYQSSVSKSDVRPVLFDHNTYDHDPASDQYGRANFSEDANPLFQAAAHARRKARVQSAHEYVPARQSIGRLGCHVIGDDIIASTVTFAIAFAHQDRPRYSRIFHMKRTHLYFQVPHGP